MTRIQQGGDYLNLGSAVQKGEWGGFIVLLSERLSKCCDGRPWGGEAREWCNLRNLYFILNQLV